MKNFIHAHSPGFFLAIFLFWIITFCCQAQDKDAPPSQKDVNAMIQNMQNMQNPGSSLNNLQPLTPEQLKSWFPPTLKNLERVHLEQANGAIPQVTALQAKYITPDQPEFISPDGRSDVINTKNKSLLVEVMDGAGPYGSQMMASMSMMTSMNFEKNDEREEQKVVVVKGIRAQQKFEKKTGKTTLNFIHNERFMIAITANHLTPEQTWKFVELLKLEELDQLGN